MSAFFIGAKLFFELVACFSGTHTKSVRDVTDFYIELELFFINGCAPVDSLAFAEEICIPFIYMMSYFLLIFFC